MLTLGDGARPSFTVHDYLIDHDQQTRTATISDTIWDAALAEAKDLDSRTKVGSSALLEWRLDVATEAFITGAEAGDTYSQYILGNMMTNLPPQDLVEGRRWYTAAAEAGETAAQYGLGFLLAYQLGPPELGEAFRWFTAAAEAGHIGTQYYLGTC